MTRRPSDLKRIGPDGVETLRLFPAICGKNKTLPLENYQSPEILKLIERERFAEEAAQFEATHRGLFIAMLCEPAAQEVETIKAIDPSRPICLDRFIFEQGMAYSTLDYSGA